LVRNPQYSGIASPRIPCAGWFRLPARNSQQFRYIVHPILKLGADYSAEKEL
jgi:hypothetical protein